MAHPLLKVIILPVKHMESKSYDKINMLIRHIKRFEETKDYYKFVKILSHGNWHLSKFSASDKLPYKHDTINDYFIHLCKKGHLSIAQWLYSLGGVDIHTKNDYAFKKSPTKITS